MEFRDAHVLIIIVHIHCNRVLFFVYFSQIHHTTATVARWNIRHCILICMLYEFMHYSVYASNNFKGIVG
jgi:hypothetical protein